MRETVETITGTVLVILLIYGMFAVASWLGGCAHPDTRLVPILEAGQPACIVVLGPPPAPPMEYRDLPRCAFPGVAPDEPCLTAEQSNTLARWAAQTQLYALSAYRACQVSDEGVTDDVRILP